MKWTYKFEAQMDTNDADYVEKSGELGTYDDTDMEEMLIVHLQMLYLNCYAGRFDDGYADEEEVMKDFTDAAHGYGITDGEIDWFIEKHMRDEWEFKPRDPNDDSRAHDLYFTFSRIPANVKEEGVDADDIRTYFKRQPIKDEGNNDEAEDGD
jgi:hypothetical protein